MSRTRLQRAALPLCWLLLACSAEPRGRHDREGEPPLAEPDPLGDSLIVPDSRVGPVRVGISEAELAQRLGRENLVRREAYLAEGFCAPGSLLFQDRPAELEIVWSDSTHSEPALVRVARPGSRWRSSRGVTVGTSLAELERLAGKPIDFSGFGWDYGGTATWPEEGPMEDGSITLQLTSDSLALDRLREDPRYPEILGERQVRSDHPLIRTMDVRVERLSVRLGRWPEERECSLP